MMDIFIRSTKKLAPLRDTMAMLVEERWDLEPGVNILWIWDMDIYEGRVFAERHAKSDPYIVTDDDVLIVGKDWVMRGLEAMLANPRFAICSSLSLVEGENLARPPDDSPIYPMHAVGAPMWIRKGILKDIPPMDLNSECGVLHKYVLDLGYEEGLFNPSLRIRHNHLGHGFSSNPSLFWGY